MKYYSELTKKLYDSKEELVKAEVEMTKAKSERAERAKEVENALKEAREAQKKANDLLSQFVKDFGSFKTTFKDEDVKSDPTLGFWDIFDRFLI